MILERFFTRLEIDITTFNQKKSNRNLFSSFEITIDFCNVKILSNLCMSGKKIMWLVTDEPVEFEKNPVEVQDFRKFTDRFRGIYRMCLN